MRPNLVSIDELANGTIISVSHGLFDHVALLGDRRLNGERTVLAFSREADGFLEQPYSDFARGRQIVDYWYPSNLPSAVVMGRARSLRGWPYSLLRLNCECFVRYAHGLSVESPQVNQWVTFGGLFAFIALASRA